MDSMYICGFPESMDDLIINKRFVLGCILSLIHINIWSQCGTTINSFPYRETFELNNGSWVSGGTANDWAWGTPSKPVINSAGEGNKCWVIGGLTGSSYNDGESSWLQSPCFDFSGLTHPYISFKVFWEMERRFDGASLQYSIDNGNSWQTLGGVNDELNCLNSNWYNNPGITYLTLSTDKQGWSGNKQANNGSCNGGSGSAGWVTAKHTMPSLAGRSQVSFRFIFGAGTICNSYDGFAFDDIFIGEAPANAADFTYSCASSQQVNFASTSSYCPKTFSWNFGDPLSPANTSAIANPSHIFSNPGSYTITLTVTGPDNLPSTITKVVSVLSANIVQLSAADCQTNNGGSLSVTYQGTANPVSITWNTLPVQSGATAVNLSAGIYSVTINGNQVCPLTITGTVETDPSCTGVYFPSAFTPDNNGKNDDFGAMGNLSSIKEYKLSVYNRWGQLLFSTNNPFEKWKGKMKGSATDSNLFIWTCDLKLNGKPKEKRKGTVYLIR